MVSKYSSINDPHRVVYIWHNGALYARVPCRVSDISYQDTFSKGQKTYKAVLGYHIQHYFDMSDSADRAIANTSGH